ncbi:MAG TPA: transposase, partial [Balneolaceae bacterium]|nr:transposase [Balneolaceae bacterium]
YMRCEVTYKGLPVTVFLVRYSGQRRWRMIVCSDRSLGFTRVMRLYSIRWSIEVFFKEAKQHLQLGASQAQNLDGQIADITLSMIRYTLLSFRKRFTAYETLGELFAAYREQLLTLTITEQIWGLILQWARQLCHVLELSPEWVLQKLIRLDSDAHWKLVELLHPLIEPGEASGGLPVG